MNLSGQIEEVHTISPSDFNEHYFKTQTPLVIKGLSQNTDAGKRWNLRYFKDSMGELLVDIYDNGNKNSSAGAFTSADLKMKLSDYLNIIEKDEHTDLRIFLCNLFKYNPSLQLEFPCPSIFSGALNNLGFMFFGGKNTTVRIHYDVDMSNVLHTHFGGKKRVVLISPEYSTLLYKLPLNTFSLIDPDKPDYKKYPGLKFIKGAEVILEPGDSIFMPAGYWHYMTYLEGSFSVSYRKLSHNLKHPCEGISNLILKMPLDKILNKVLGKSWLNTKQKIAQNKANAILQKQTNS